MFSSHLAGKKSPHLFCLFSRNQFFKKLRARLKFAFSEFPTNLAQIWRERCQIIWHQNRASKFHFFAFIQRKRGGVFLNFKVKLSAENKPGQIKNSETRFLRQRCEEFGAMFALPSKSFLSGAELILWMMYFWKTLSIFSTELSVSCKYVFVILSYQAFRIYIVCLGFCETPDTQTVIKQCCHLGYPDTLSEIEKIVREISSKNASEFFF